MRVIVTGGSGFLGSFVCERLVARGHEPVVVDDRAPRWTPELPWRRMDVAEERPVMSLEQEGPDAVLHLAGVLGTAETFDHPQETVRTNVIGTVNVLEMCRRSGATYVGVQTGTPWRSPYAISKRAATDFARGYHEAFDMRTTVLRVFNAYGPRQDGVGPVNKIVPRFAVNALRGEPLPIFGDGRQVIDVVHAEDVAECFVRALERAPGTGEVVDVGSGVPVTVLDVARRVAAIAGDTGLEFLPRRIGEGREYPVAQTDETERLLDFVPAPIDERLADTVEWYRVHALEGSSLV